MLHPIPEGTVQSAACLERIRLWHKRAWLVVLVCWCGIGLIAASATSDAQSAAESPDRLSGTPSKDPEATVVFIVDAKKCGATDPRKADALSKPELWAWQQIGEHLNVDFDEREADRSEWPQNRSSNCGDQIAHQRRR
jgi:hypothetical protein